MDERVILGALAVIGAGVGTVTWWRWRSTVLRLLREILAELRKGPDD